MSEHIIHKQTFQIGVTTEEQAHKAGNAVKDLYVQKILPALDDVFSDLSPEDQIYRFNRIEIDLGFFQEEVLDPELPGRLTQRIKQAVSERIEQAAFQTPESQKMEVIPVSASLFDAFLHYLEYGILPWWHKVEDGELPLQIFKNLPVKPDQNQVLKLRQAIKKESARTRLARQFSDDFISDILKATQTAETKRSDNEDDQELVLFSELLSGMINTLEKLQVPKEIRTDFRLEMVREMLNHKLALSHSPLEFDPKKTNKALRDFIASSVEILIKTLALHGSEAEEIIALMERFSEHLSEKSIPGYWFTRQNFTKKKIEGIVKKAHQKSPEKTAIKKTDIPTEAEEKPFAGQSGIYIKNAGAVLLWPFIKTYFSKMELLGGDKFRSAKEQYRAAVLLQYLATGRNKFAEQELPLNKIMCGLPVDEPLNTDLKLTPKEKKESDAMILSAIETWKAIGKVSVEGFRESFLKREGRLTKTENGWSLKVERKTIDILLDKLPWMISMVKLKWMKQMIYVDW